MEFSITLGIVGWVAVIVGALVFGAIAQLVGDARTGFEWLGDAIGFGIGAVVASEFIVALQAFEPVFDGLATAPALAGGLVVGVVVEVATRYLTGGTYADRPMTA
jgi:hypothetical protein